MADNALQGSRLRGPLSLSIAADGANPPLQNYLKGHMMMIRKFPHRVSKTMPKGMVRADNHAV